MLLLVNLLLAVVLGFVGAVLDLRNRSIPLWLPELTALCSLPFLSGGAVVVAGCLGLIPYVFGKEEVERFMGTGDFLMLAALSLLLGSAVVALFVVGVSTLLCLALAAVGRREEVPYLVPTFLSLLVVLIIY